jgi:hypothetical protein
VPAFWVKQVKNKPFHRKGKQMAEIIYATVLQK